MSNRTPHVVGGGLGTLRVQDAHKWAARQAAVEAERVATVTANNAAIMRAMATRKSSVSLAKG
jgi:hypothetical protein